LTIADVAGELTVFAATAYRVAVTPESESLHSKIPRS
jgi:hypothetical protein